jgi:hypothetical protein
MVTCTKIEYPRVCYIGAEEIMVWLQPKVVPSTNHGLSLHMQCAPWMQLELDKVDILFTWHNHNSELEVERHQIHKVWKLSNRAQILYQHRVLITVHVQGNCRQQLPCPVEHGRTSTERGTQMSHYRNSYRRQVRTTSSKQENLKQTGASS